MGWAPTRVHISTGCAFTGLQPMALRRKRWAGVQRGPGGPVRMAAMLMGGGNLTREDGETVEAFAARADVGAAGAVFLPDNGRDALVTDKARAGLPGR